MALFTALTLASGALVASSMVQRKPTPPRLVDALIDGEPKQATLLPPKTQQTVARVQALAQDLFSDTRQQHQQALNTTYAGDEEQDAETTARRNLLITTTGLGLATAGMLLSPLFYLPSALCALYATRMFFQDAWEVYQREKRLDYRAIWALTIPVALVGGFVWAANFGLIFDPATESPVASLLSLIAGTEAPDPQTIVFQLSDGHADFPLLLVSRLTAIIPAGTGHHAVWWVQCSQAHVG